MLPEERKETVLVTGGSGYVAGMDDRGPAKTGLLC